MAKTSDKSSGCLVSTCGQHLPLGRPVTAGLLMSSHPWGGSHHCTQPTSCGDFTRELPRLPRPLSCNLKDEAPAPPPGAGGMCPISANSSHWRKFPEKTLLSILLMFLCLHCGMEGLKATNPACPPAFTFLRAAPGGTQ